MRRFIIGPPGTGKTTALLNILEEELRNGTQSERIAFVSFTRRASEEAISRACDKFSLVKDDFPFFRTLHSMAFMLHGYRRENVLQPKHLREVGNLLGLTFSGRNITEEGLPAPTSRGDRYLFLDGYAKARCITPEAGWQRLDDAEELNWYEFQRFRSTLEDFKKARDLVDFADMLVDVPCADVDAVILDEAQDCSTAQWKMFWEVFKDTPRLYIAGDDDQAIFTWAGADVHHFQNLEGFEKVNLTQSHRIPAEVHTLAESLTTRMRKRYPKSYNPRKAVGSIEYHRQPDDVAISSTPGTWLLLARNGYHLKQLAAIARGQGVPYTYRGAPAVDPGHVRAIKRWEARRAGKALSRADLAAIDDFTRGDTDPSLIWHEALSKIPLEDREFYTSLLRRGESLTATPRVTISTIHGVKGGEADNVLLLSDMTQKTFDNYLKHPDTEHRVFYVAVTRTKNNLHIVMPQTNRGYLL